MSEISVLSSQYKKLVATSDIINNSVIAFKKKKLLLDKANLAKHPKLEVSKEELNMAKDSLLPFLNNVKQILEEDYLQSEFIPSPILKDYKNKLSADFYLKEGINKLVDNLGNDLPITDEEIEILDKVLYVVDNERSNLFRKLRKARG